MTSPIVDMSIITSLYASARHLPGFLARLEACIRSVESAGYSVQSIVVSNAPDGRERRILREVSASAWWRSHGRLIVVPRETLYASWNRGLRAASGSAVGFWNVDDYRNSAALAEGIELIRQGRAVVRFPWVQVSTDRNVLASREQRTVVFCDQKDQAGLDPRADFCLGPFFVFRRDLFDEFGPFDEQLHIVGDYDWQLRVVPHTGLDWGEELAGVFYTDGRNLCGSGSPRLLVEQNVLFERYRLDRELWSLDAPSQQLRAGYRIQRSEDCDLAREWSYERHWRRRATMNRVYGEGRRMAGTLRRLARSWQSRS